MRAEIERDAETKRNAINAVLGNKDGKTASARTWRPELVHQRDPA
ncbi:hypothetical protein [Corynebacterium kozikiae]|nr:hypothetical protein [Corynebacterium sp. 76QC2CO]MCQ9342740.1 hypothetical protein [Corynebacterium sp. 76QC2CO]